MAENQVPMENQQEQTFTQSDVDALIQKRLERERKKYPSDAELSAYRAWKENHESETEKLQAVTGERDAAKTSLAAAQAELEQMKREKFLLGKGVPADDVDYYTFKIGKLVSDSVSFEKAAESFISEHPTARARVDMTASVGGGSGGAMTTSEQMNKLIRNSIR